MLACQDYPEVTIERSFGQWQWPCEEHPGALSAVNPAAWCYMPGLDGGHMEKGAPTLPVNSRLEVQGMKEGQENTGS